MDATHNGVARAGDTGTWTEMYHNEEGFQTQCADESANTFHAQTTAYGRTTERPESNFPRVCVINDDAALVCLVFMFDGHQIIISYNIHKNLNFINVRSHKARVFNP